MTEYKSIDAKLDKVLEEISCLKEMMKNLSSKNMNVAQKLDKPPLPDPYPNPFVDGSGRHPHPNPFGVGGGSDSLLVGPNHPIFKDITKPDVPFGVPPGARFDPFTPLGLGIGLGTSDKKTNPPFGPKPDHFIPPE